MMIIFTFPVYLCYLVFQLFSHKNLYEDDGADVQKSVAYPSNVAKMAKRLHMPEPPASRSPIPTDVTDPAQRDVRSVEAGSEEEGEKPEMCLQTTIGLLVTVTVVCQWLISLTALGSDRAEQLVAITAEFLVDSINGLTSSGHISKGFVGLILLPIVGNAAGMPS